MAASNSLSSSVLEAVPLVMRVIRKELRARRDPDLTLPEFRALGFVNRNPGCPLNELAEHVGVEAPSASKLVENLVRRGLVRRIPHAVDRRRVQLSATAKGARSIERAFDHTRQFIAEHLAHLDKDEQDQLMQSMEILKEAFSREPALAK